VWPLGNLLNDAQWQHDAAVDEGVAAVKDPGHPEIALPRAHGPPDAEVVDPRRPVADQRLVAARPPA
jgi:hypothetical protein